MIWLTMALAAVTTEDLAPCEGPMHAQGTRFVLRVHTEVLLDDTVIRQRTADETWVLDDSTPWPATLNHLSVGCKRVLSIPAENASAAGLTEKHPGAAVRMVIGVQDIVSPERKPPEAPHEVPTVLRTSTGLGYVDLQVGDGARPEIGQRAVVEYTLWLQNGTRIDTSYKRPEPFSYNVGRGQVIAGWEEGVRGMRVGGERQLHVPWKLGYGRRGSPPNIPEKADLIFEVKLLRLE